jgi:hypothetical protein
VFLKINDHTGRRDPRHRGNIASDDTGKRARADGWAESGRRSWRPPRQAWARMLTRDGYTNPHRR